MTRILTVDVFFAPSLPIFFFATNKWNVVLTSAQKIKVEQTLRVLEAHGIKTLWLTGYADIRGSHAANVILGSNRAKSVQAYLTGLLKTLHLKPMSFFRQVVGASKQWGTLGNNRRVEVSYSPFVK
jgi:outer membrane protein OmpA-like peptidoglycan-associated protein